MVIISKLTIRNLINNKKRTFASIFAIMITAILLFSIGFIFSTYRKHEIDKVIKNNNYDSIFYDIPYSKHQILDSNKDIKYYISYTFIGNYNVLNQSNISFYSVNDFNKIKLIKGDYPKNNREVLLSKIIADNLSLIVSDTIIIEDKIYKVTGLYDSFYIPNMNNSYNNVFTIDNENQDSKACIYVYLQNKKNAYNKLYKIASSLDLKKTIDNNYENMDINNELLNLYINYQDNAKQMSIYLTLMLILFVLSICLVFIIYNSFSVSLLERKKQYGILKSIGMTNRQLRKMVFLEAIYLSIISLPIGFLISFVICKIFIIIINNIGVYNYVITIYPSYLIISLIFILLTTLYSVLFPAMRVSEIIPMEAIRKSRDIKRKKVNPFIRKILGIDISMIYYNMKRNKKIYRTSVISIIISILLFTFVSTYINFFNKISNLNNQETGIYINLYGDDDKEVILNKIKNLNGINKYIYYYSINNITFDNTNKGMYTLEYQNINFMYHTINIIKLDNNTLSKIKNEYHITSNEPIFINYFINERLENGYIIGYDKGNILNDSYSLGLCNFEYDVEKDTYYKENCTTPYKIQYINEIPKYLKEFNFSNMLIVDDTLFNKFSNSDDLRIHLLANDYIKIDDEIKDILSNTSDYTFMNYGKDKMIDYNNYVIIKIIIYSLISLFGLVATTSFMNVIIASLNFRKREFAVLKSIGMSNKRLTKMLILEGTLVCIKAFIWAIPISIFVVFLSSIILKISDNKILFSNLFPTNYLIIFMIIIFIIVLLIMILITKEFKKTNLIDDIKKENI